MNNPRVWMVALAVVVLGVVILLVTQTQNLSNTLTTLEAAQRTITRQFDGEQSGHCRFRSTANGGDAGRRLTVTGRRDHRCCRTAQALALRRPQTWPPQPSPSP
jgi:hypothetical protein